MINFSHVTKTFGTRCVLNDLSLYIPKGKITFILGKSGEGKSVTIKHIMGLMKPDSGLIQVDGHEVTTLTEEEARAFRKNFGLLFQHAALFDHLNVFENILFPLLEHKQNLSRKEMHAKVIKILKRIDLNGFKHKYPSELSTGEKKRVGLARALVHSPKVILYDEPTTGMDPLIAEMIDDLIVRVNEDEELTSVVISHDLKAALNTADLIIMLYKGTVVMQGTPNEFRASEHPVIRQFFSGSVNGPMEFT